MSFGVESMAGPGPFWSGGIGMGRERHGWEMRMRAQFPMPQTPDSKPQTAIVLMLAIGITDASRRASCKASKVLRLQGVEVRCHAKPKGPAVVKGDC